jgi:hypothetical protein
MASIRVGISFDDMLEFAYFQFNNTITVDELVKQYGYYLEAIGE